MNALEIILLALAVLILLVFVGGLLGARRRDDHLAPEFDYDGLHLVLVDDRPGVDEDRAHFVAVGSGGETRVVLSRTGGHWGAESVD